VAFTDDNDGVRLRCYEFLRLAQMPRVWPAVNLELLDRWQEHGNLDEGDTGAWKTLTEYARTFDKDCHRLKRLMAMKTQEIALGASRKEPIELEDVASAIDAQSNAMKRLDERITTDDPALLSDRSKGTSRVNARVEAAQTLQLQQLVAVGMGLRAEWRLGAGLAAWVRATALTDALAGAKFMARLKDGQIKASEATCSVTLRKEPWGSPLERFDFALKVATEGVSADVLREAYGDEGSASAQRP
jgi:hypothetical protein